MTSGTSLIDLQEGGRGSRRRMAGVRHPLGVVNVSLVVGVNASASANGGRVLHRGMSVPGRKKNLGIGESATNAGGSVDAVGGLRGTGNNGSGIADETIHGTKKMTTSKYCDRSFIQDIPIVIDYVQY